MACERLSCSIWDPVPWPGIEAAPPALGAWCLSHWTTREVPHTRFFKSVVFNLGCAWKSSGGALCKILLSGFCFLKMDWRGPGHGPGGLLRLSRWPYGGWKHCSQSTHFSLHKLPAWQSFPTKLPTKITGDFSKNYRGPDPRLDSKNQNFWGCGDFPLGPLVRTPNFLAGLGGWRQGVEVVWELGSGMPP